ncbi:MAG: hypothetical protein C0592_07625 [Marinilabiliales bacterium]|nr:MAG: hypothetical protein C0592_07625 [Marinilabiliales bacterium]
MRKLFILMGLIIFLFSCKKENNLPVEYSILVGNWELDSYMVRNNPSFGYSTVDSFPVDSLGYNIRFDFTQSGFTKYVENTKAIESTLIESVVVNTVYDSSGISIIGYYFIYRTQEPFVTYALSVGYDYKEDILSHSCSNSEYNSPVYTFKFKKN